MRACRVSVKVQGVKDVGSGPPLVILEVEGSYFCITESKVEQGVHVVGQSHAFDVKDEKTAELTISIASKNAVGMRKLVGKTRPIRIADLLGSSNALTHSSQWLELVSKDGKKVVEGQVLIEAAAAHAPPEQEIALFIGTWNIGNKPPPADLSPWLAGAADATIVAIGTQECEYTPRPGFSSCQDDWVGTLREYFGPNFKLVKATYRGQMRLVILVKEEDYKAISDVACASEATGVAHVLANKGGVAVAFKFWDTPLCFVNSHLAAHEGQCNTRNDNYQEIVRNIRPGHPYVDILNQFHHLFWMGDLNYRLSFISRLEAAKSADSVSSVDDDDEDDAVADEKVHPMFKMVLQNIEMKWYHTLLQNDELQREIKADRAFHAFLEGPIDFAPTFKMHKNELQEYARKRLPAWCDRVLWRSLPGCEAKCTSYSSAPTVLTSDHKPVCGTYKLTTYALPVRMAAGEAQVDLDPGSAADDMRWHIHISELRGKNLNSADPNGYSDPYIQFVGENLIKTVTTKRKNKTLNPVWSNDDVPVVVLQHKSLKRVEKDYLHCAVFDYDLTTRDDPLGFAAIPLAEAAQQAMSGQALTTTNFKAPVTYKGVPAGYLEGSLQLTWEVNSVSEAKCAPM